MSSEIRSFRVDGEVYLDREEVIDWLNESRSAEDELDYDYMPTDDEWRDCALEKFENDEIRWSESDLTPA